MTNGEKTKYAREHLLTHVLRYQALTVLYKVFWGLYIISISLQCNQHSPVLIIISVILVQLKSIILHAVLTSFTSWLTSVIIYFLSLQSFQSVLWCTWCNDRRAPGLSKTRCRNPKGWSRLSLTGSNCGKAGWLNKNWKLYLF